MIYVASYCRVSTDKDDQANSFEAQQRYFKEYIDRQPDWEEESRKTSSRVKWGQTRQMERGIVLEVLAWL